MGLFLMSDIEEYHASSETDIYRMAYLKPLTATDIEKSLDAAHPPQLMTGHCDIPRPSDGMSTLHLCEHHGMVRVVWR